MAGSEITPEMGDVLDEVASGQLTGKGKTPQMRRHDVIRVLVRRIIGHDLVPGQLSLFNRIVQAMVADETLRFDESEPGQVKLVPGDNFEVVIVCWRAGRAERLRGRLRSMAAEHPSAQPARLRAQRVLEELVIAGGIISDPGGGSTLLLIATRIECNATDGKAEMDGYSRSIIALSKAGLVETLRLRSLCVKITDAGVERLHVLVKLGDAGTEAYLAELRKLFSS